MQRHSWNRRETMSKKKYKGKVRADPVQEKSDNASLTYLCDVGAFDMLCSSGYTSLAKNPEIISAVNKIANLIGSMSIHLMQNTTDKGDIRIRNGLSRKIDIEPNRYMTRSTFIQTIVRALLLEGDGNAVVLPKTKDGLLDDLLPIPPSQTTFLPDGYGYKIMIYGQTYEPWDLIHIAMNPNPEVPWKGEGYRKSLKQVAETLLQASITKKGFMESKWKPSIIVKVDADTDELSSKEGRSQLLKKYVTSTEAGEPWLLPADSFEVETVKPLSLKDLAIQENVELDKKTVAAILDVPPFVLGIGEFKADAWNNFINTRIKTICQCIEQAFTKAVLIDPTLYFRFNARSLHSYDLDTLANVGANLYTRGIMEGNEVRDWIDMPHKDGLDELVILENYIPAGMIGDQKKLKKKEGEKDE